MTVVARKNSNWLVVSSLPDVCKTPMGCSVPPVPYPVIAKLENCVNEVKSVRANGDSVVAFDYTKVPQTLGDQAGTANGVKSGTVGADSWPIEHSKTVYTENKQVIRHGDKFAMNGKKNLMDQKKMSVRMALKRQKELLETKKMQLERWNQKDKDIFEENFGTGSATEENRKLMGDRVDKMLELNKNIPMDNFRFAELPGQPRTLAFVDPNDPLHNISLTDNFFSSENIDIQASTLTHEMSHFVDIGGTVDYFDEYLNGRSIYGYGPSKTLANSRPDLVLQHADTFAYWVGSY